MVNILELNRKRKRLSRRGRKPKFTATDLQRLQELLLEQPDATLEELRGRTGVSCSLTTVFNTIKRLGFRHYKRAKSSRGRIVRRLPRKVERREGFTSDRRTLSAKEKLKMMAGYWRI